MPIWRTFEFRGRDANNNPFVDFGFVEVEVGRLALSSHMLREPLWVTNQAEVLPRFQHYYESHGVSQLRYKVLWEGNTPVDTPFDEGWRLL
jgi:hypothetical protein